MADEPRWKVEKVGLGYRATPTNDKIDASISVGRIKRSSEGMSGNVQIRVNFEGVKTINGVLHSARFNLSSSQTRKQLGTLLTSRTPGFETLDWFDALEALCQGVMESESRGEPVEAIGDGRPPASQRPTRVALDPLVPANVASLLYGPGGIGKSVLALAGALSVAVDAEIIPGIPPKVHGPALYLDWETDAYVVNDRLWALAVGAGIEPANMSYRRCNRPLADDAEELAMLVAERHIVYLVIDSCGPAMGTSGEYGDANESTLRLFEAIRHIGVTTQIVDHVSKQEMRNSKGKVTGLLPYGSIYKVNLSRAAWELRSGGPSGDDDPMRITLLNTKANDSRLHEAINLQVEWDPTSITFMADNDEPYQAPRPTTGTSELRDLAYGILMEEPSHRMEARDLAILLGLRRKDDETKPDTAQLRVLVQRNPEFIRPADSRTAIMLDLSTGGGVSNVVSFMAARGSNDQA